jgi:hypothetical protein
LEELGRQAVRPKEGGFMPYFARFFDRIAVKTCENRFFLAKSGGFLPEKTA